MITDQDNKGIPSAARGRMQLVKPVQTLNSGSTQRNPLDPDAAARAITAERYNPIQPKNAPNPLSAPSVSPKPQITTAVKPSVDGSGYNSKYGYATGVFDKSTGEELFSNPSFAGQGAVATPSYQDMVESLGKQFSGLTEDDQIRFLNNVAQGIYKANGIKTNMTGEPNSNNTLGTRIGNLGRR